MSIMSRSGDTISSIAMKFGINAKHLIELNKIANPSLIYVGQELKIVENKLSKSDKIINTVSAKKATETEMFSMMQIVKGGHTSI